MIPNSCANSKKTRQTKAKWEKQMKCWRIQKTAVIITSIATKVVSKNTQFSSASLPRIQMQSTSKKNVEFCLKAPFLPLNAVIKPCGCKQNYT